MGNGAAANCTATLTPTGFPWTATATSTTNIQIHGINIDVVVENTPGNPVLCQFTGGRSF
jgi:hypothetical protein